MKATPKTGFSDSSSSVELVAIPPEKTDKVWNLVRPLIAEALLQTRDIDAETVRRMAAEGKLQLWVVWEKVQKEALAGVVTELMDGPLRRVARILLLGGRLLNQWKHLLTELEAWAREEGCAALEIQGRKGWAKILPDEYEKTRYVFSREL